MKQITIYELLPLLKKGWVAYAPRHGWIWYPVKPKPVDEFWMYQTMQWYRLEPTSIYSPYLDIAPFDGDWKDSLIKVEYKEEE